MPTPAVALVSGSIRRRIRRAICLIGIKGNRAVERYIVRGDIIQRQRVRRLALVIVHIDPVTRLAQFRGDTAPFFRVYDRPGSISLWSIQMMVAWN